ncbi:MAG: acyl-CoA dehydrogenase [Actinobacteria bacterium]|nr:acyl-CoA dehydrogenase [Actinomycetota bacterium]
MLASPLAEAARAAGGQAAAALPVADAAAAFLAGAPVSAAAVHELLTGLAEIDLTVARVVEPHLDALLILGEAGMPAEPGRWGVFAAEAPDAVLTATRDGTGWRLDGTKAWCSLAGLLDRALVTARTPDGPGLFAVEVRSVGVTVTDPARWAARGLSTVVSTPVRFEAVAAEPVGAAGWYLRRPGFAFGGIRVAACWYGGARAVRDHLHAALADRPQPDPIRQVALGRADVACWSAGLALEHAAAAIDAGGLAGPAAELLAARTRAVVADAVETVLTESGHALGPAPLAFDEAHARRVADLQLYVRQHHAERDLAALAGLLPVGP